MSIENWSDDNDYLGWGTQGSVSKLGSDIDVLVLKVSEMKKHFDRKNLNPEIAVKRVKQIQDCLALLEAHVKEPKKYN